MKYSMTKVKFGDTVELKDVGTIGVVTKVGVWCGEDDSTENYCEVHFDGQSSPQEIEINKLKYVSGDDVVVH